MIWICAFCSCSKALFCLTWPICVFCFQLYHIDFLPEASITSQKPREYLEMNDIRRAFFFVSFVFLLSVTAPFSSVMQGFHEEVGARSFLILLRHYLSWLLLGYLNGINKENIENPLPTLPWLPAPKNVSETPVVGGEVVYSPETLGGFTCHHWLQAGGVLPLLKQVQVLGPFSHLLYSSSARQSLQ